MFSREMKKGNMELLIMALLEARPRHGYEIGKLIESRSGGGNSSSGFLLSTLRSVNWKTAG